MGKKTFTIDEEGEEAESEITFFNQVECVDLRKRGSGLNSPFRVPSAG